MAAKRIPNHIRKICDILKDDRVDYQCAAAVVLGEIGVKDTYVIRALGDVLSNGDDRGLITRILDAFEKIKSKESLQYLLPFLFKTDTDESEFTERAITIASSLGSESAKEMRSMLKTVDANKRCIINSIFIKMHNLEGLKVVLESLQDKDEKVINETCRLMKDEMKDITSSEKKTFSSKIEIYLRDKRVIKSRQTISAAINILGFIGCPDSQAALLSFTTLQNHPSIRSQALMALKNLSLHTTTKIEVIKKLISYLDESDFSNIVSPTMDILMRMPFQTRMADMVIRLLDNQHEAVRKFAIKKMRELNSPKVVRMLVEKLSDRDSSIRDLAGESLCWLDSARTILLDRILKEEDLELCHQYARILKPHAVKFRANQISRLCERLDTLLDVKSPLNEPYLYLLRTVAPDLLHDSLVRRSKRFKQKKDFKQAGETLQILQQGGHISEEAKYELAICLLKQRPQSRGLPERDPNSCFHYFQQLIKEGVFPLLERVKSEKVLTREDLYFLASYFIDKLQKEREFGSALLKLLVKKHPRSKVGIASSNHLKEIQI